MKEIKDRLVCLVCVSLLFACGNTPKTSTNLTLSESNQNSASTLFLSDKPTTDIDTTSIETEVRTRVTAIYDTIFSWYIVHVEDTAYKDFDTEEYLSDNYMSIMQQVLQHDSKLEGEIGFFESDHWVQGQDWCKDLAMQIDSVERVDTQHAYCHIQIQNGGNKTPLTLSLVRQKTEWYIDDFIYKARQCSEKELMLMYLSDSE